MKASHGPKWSALVSRLARSALVASIAGVAAVGGVAGCKNDSEPKPRPLATPDAAASTPRAAGWIPTVASVRSITRSCAAATARASMAVRICLSTRPASNGVRASTTRCASPAGTAWTRVAPSTTAPARRRQHVWPASVRPRRAATDAFARAFTPGGARWALSRHHEIDNQPSERRRHRRTVAPEDRLQSQQDRLTP